MRERVRERGGLLRLRLLQRKRRRRQCQAGWPAYMALAVDSRSPLIFSSWRLTAAAVAAAAGAVGSRLGGGEVGCCRGCIKTTPHIATLKQTATGTLPLPRHVLLYPTRTRQVNLRGAVLDHKPGHQVGIHHRLELDVLAARQLLQLLGDQELLLLLQLHRRAQGGHLRGRGRNRGRGGGGWGWGWG